MTTADRLAFTSSNLKPDSRLRVQIGPRDRTVLFLALLALLPCWFGCGTPEDAAATSRTESRLYVSDETGGNVAVGDPGSGRLIERMAAGTHPRGMALSPM